MKVLVLGASGFIGLPAAQAFVRAGHTVYGVTRSAAKAKQLAAEEIIPIICEVDQFDNWTKYLGTIDVLIDAVGGTADIKTLSANLLSAVSQAAKKLRAPHATKLTYIYSSGTWVHGDNRSEIVSDTTACTKPMPLVAWRVEQEQRVINDPVLNGIVIRPALLYGRSGSLLAPLFESASKGKVAWYGTPGGRYALIHCDDLADLYLRAAEKAQLVGGKIFDAANDFTESQDDVLNKLVEVSGAKGPYEWIKPEHPYHDALACTCLLRPYLARALLGWQPKKPGLVDGLSTYYAAWKASAGLA
ncbi:NAD P-binding protein [Gloeophyllum trabeum ATCC 11539]|uniref:NAD P-binding protein n=1 Tax=Gloeophyllum trabeum (strain ATCC 11539 / FP-39264 / Madison 617) TaxID=670483 RepID=S7Q4F7_GLOTA|nr:NAD P-binding protein [Gloeophyllum trabeum ATCC 11539]EPQ54392.1 NAD P-binding protein [Gloeophyllum trabeum ATCC 11539]